MLGLHHRNGAEQNVTRETELVKVPMEQEREPDFSRTKLLQSRSSSRGGGGAEVGGDVTEKEL